MKKKKWIEGDLYRVRFLDHCRNSDDPLTFDICGWLVANKKSHIVLSNWKSTENWLDHIEKDVVVKSTIVKVENLTSNNPHTPDGTL